MMKNSNLFLAQLGHQEQILDLNIIEQMFKISSGKHVLRTIFLLSKGV